MSNSLRLLMTKEQPERITQKQAIRSKTSDSLKKMGFLKFFPIFMPKNELLFAQSLFFKEKQWENCSGHSLLQSDYEQFAPVALYKIAIVSYLLRSLMTKERREQFALSQEWITQKTDEQIPNPGLD